MKDNLGISDQISFTITKEKELIRDGRVAILYSPMGWYTKHLIIDLLRDIEVVNMVESFEPPIHIVDYCKKTYGPGHSFYGAADLRVEWIELGDKFRITQINNIEVIEYLTSTLWMEA